MVAVAQLVERTTEDRKVTCSIQVSDTYFYFRGMSNVCSTIYFLTRVSHRRPSAIPPDDFHYHHDVSSKSDGLAGRVHGPTTRLRARSSAASRFGAGRVSPPLDLHPSPPLPPSASASSPTTSKVDLRSEQGDVRPLGLPPACSVTSVDISMGSIFVVEPTATRARRDGERLSFPRPLELTTLPPPQVQRPARQQGLLLSLSAYDLVLRRLRRRRQRRTDLAESR